VRYILIGIQVFGAKGLELLHWWSSKECPNRVQLGRSCFASSHLSIVKRYVLH